MDETLQVARLFFAPQSGPSPKEGVEGRDLQRREDPETGKIPASQQAFLSSFKSDHTLHYFICTIGIICPDREHYTTDPEQLRRFFPHFIFGVLFFIFKLCLIR